MNPKPKKSNTEDSGILKMHAELKGILSKGLAAMGERFDTLNSTQIGLAADVGHIKDTQDTQARLIDEVRMAQANCEAKNGFVGMNKRISGVEKFKEKVQETGILASKGEISQIFDVPFRRAAAAEITTEGATMSGLKKITAIIFGVAIGAAVVGYMVAVIVGKVVL